jgi:hypothetical protein
MFNGAQQGYCLGKMNDDVLEHNPHARACMKWGLLLGSHMPPPLPAAVPVPECGGVGGKRIGKGNPP